MHGAEYDELVTALDGYKDKFESVKVAEPLLGAVGEDATVVNADKKAVAEAVVAQAVSESGFDSLEAAAADGLASNSPRHPAAPMQGPGPCATGGRASCHQPVPRPGCPVQRRHVRVVRSLRRGRGWPRAPGPLCVPSQVPQMVVLGFLLRRSPRAPLPADAGSQATALSPSPHQAPPSCPAGGAPVSARPQPASPLISHTCERSCGPPGRRKSSALHRPRGMLLV